MLFVVFCLKNLMSNQKSKGKQNCVMNDTTPGSQRASSKQLMNELRNYVEMYSGCATISCFSF